MEVAVVEPVKKVTKIIAIKTFFGMTNSQTIKEVKELKQADEAGFDWVASECAKQLGVELTEFTLG
jgi:transcriptional regulator of met regulon